MRNARHEPRYVYVYCVVRGSLTSRVLNQLPTLPDGDAPRVLPLVKDTSLIVADVPAETYRADRVEARLADLDWVGRCGSAHHAVADALVSGHTVVPLRPFTLFSNEARARETFDALSRELETAFSRVSGKAEWVLRISKPDPALMSTAADAGSTLKPASGAAFLAQKAAAKRMAGERATRVREDAAGVFETLSAIADQADRREPEAATGLLLDVAFLVPARQAARFKRTLETAAKGLLRDGCRVSLTGPWPPYSFVSLDSGART